MPVMQKAQSLYGALDFDVQNLIAEEMGIPMSDVYGVATFYSQFALEPKGQHVISVCMGTACYVKNVEKSNGEAFRGIGYSAGQNDAGQQIYA